MSSFWALKQNATLRDLKRHTTSLAHLLNNFLRQRTYTSMGHQKPSPTAPQKTRSTSVVMVREETRNFKTQAQEFHRLITQALQLLLMISSNLAYSWEACLRIRPSTSSWGHVYCIISCKHVNWTGLQPRDVAGLKHWSQRCHGAILPNAFCARKTKPKSQLQNHQE